MGLSFVHVQDLIKFRGQIRQKTDGILVVQADKEHITKVSSKAECCGWKGFGRVCPSLFLYSPTQALIPERAPPGLGLWS